MLLVWLYSFCREACDTAQSGDLVNGEYANEEIESSCHPLICDQGLNSSYYTQHPTDAYAQCVRRDGEMVSHRRNVPTRYATNLCKQLPKLPAKCTHPQGMLLGLQGLPLDSLYAGQVLRYKDELVAKTGAGLFWQGGNPIYYTAKGTSEEVARNVHAVLRGHLDDLGGHHLVLRIAKDASLHTNNQAFMHVHKAPLTAASGNHDDVKALYAHSRVNSLLTTWGNLDGWLRNLRGNMRAEQILFRIDELYPITAVPSSSSSTATTTKMQEEEKEDPFASRWSCPLQRLSFWSKVTKDFSPLVPSPVRAARLFGPSSSRNMLHGTRSHPTQLFSSLYDKLANVLTSNGFCYCVNWKDCQVHFGFFHTHAHTLSLTHCSFSSISISLSL